MKGVTAIQDRFSFFRTNARLLSKALSYALIVILIQTIANVWLLIRVSYQEVRFVTTDANLRILRIPTLNEPYVTDERLMSWMSEAVIKCLTMSFSDYRLRLQECKPYFTEVGFKGFTAALDEAKWLATLTEAYLVISSAPNGPAVITGMTPPGAPIVAWTVEIPVVARFSSGGKSELRQHIIQARIVRVSSLDKFGVAIDSFVMSRNKGA